MLAARSVSGMWFCAALVMIGSGLGAAEDPPAATAYETIVAPILRARCIECHGEQKQKAKLALHTWETLVRGSDAGPVFVAGKPDESALIERLRLPLADEEHMPPEDRPQPVPDEIALLARWIERGASRTATLAELALSDSLAAAVSALPARLAAVMRSHSPFEPRWEFDPAAVAKSRAPLAATVLELQRQFPGGLTYESRTSPALHFTAAGFGRDFGDAQLAALARLSGELVWLDLSGTAITDQSASLLARFSNLIVFRAGFTDVGDEIAKAIAQLPKLKLIVLPGTNLTSASVAAFARMRSLQSLRIAGTAAEEPARAANLPVGANIAAGPSEM